MKPRPVESVEAVACWSHDETAEAYYMVFMNYLVASRFLARQQPGRSIESNTLHACSSFSRRKNSSVCAKK